MVLSPRKLVPLLVLLTSASTGTLAHAGHGHSSSSGTHHGNNKLESWGGARSHAGVAFGPDLSAVEVREKFTPNVFDDEMPLAKRAAQSKEAVKIAIEYAEQKVRN
jgi:hypothetical protein